MARVLAIDLSKSSTGYALFQDQNPVQWGNVINSQAVADYGTYPWNYFRCAKDVAYRVRKVVEETAPDEIVIEETNGSKSRYTQKLIEFLHYALLNELMIMKWSKLIYVNTSDWRRTVGVHLSKEDKAQNAKLSKAKSAAKRKGVRLNKKALGIKGRINKKHVALRYVRTTWPGLFGHFKQKDNDIADALCLGAAYVAGCPHADGK